LKFSVAVWAGPVEVLAKAATVAVPPSRLTMADAVAVEVASRSRLPAPVERVALSRTVMVLLVSGCPPPIEKPPMLKVALSRRVREVAPVARPTTPPVPVIDPVPARTTLPVLRMKSWLPELTEPVRLRVAPAPVAWMRTWRLPEVVTSPAKVAEAPASWTSRISRF